MRVIITAATVGEWMPCFLKIDNLYTECSTRFKIFFHQSGVGMMATTFSLSKLVAEEKPDFVLQAGLAGCFDHSIPLGKVFVIDKDVQGDFGVEERGRWRDVFNMQLEKANYPPYEKKMLPNKHLEKFNLLKLRTVTGITVNEITTREKRINQLLKKYNPVTESMEGAALHYVCRSMSVPFMQMRAVSNYIGERDKSKWKIKESIDNLNDTLLKYVDKLYKIV
jgi:futalosine hydrolase